MIVRIGRSDTQNYRSTGPRWPSWLVPKETVWLDPKDGSFWVSREVPMYGYARRWIRIGEEQARAICSGTPNDFDIRSEL